MTKQNQIILIRTDGDNKIGMGHVYRSIAVAEFLKNLGCKIHFLTSNNKLVIKKLNKYGTCHIGNNLKTEIKKIEEIKPNIIIIDLLKKFFPYNYQYMKNIQKLCNLLVTIDFTGKEVQYSDIGIHSLFKPKKFTAKNSFYDIKYSIVRDSFLEARKKYKVKKHVKSILVLQGGSDTNCITPKIIKSLNKIEGDFIITVIVGSAFKCWNQLNETSKNLGKKIIILHDIEKIHSEMLKHDIAITAGGNSMIELMTIGIPTVIVYGNKHEDEIAEYMNKKKMSINAGYGKNISQKQIILKIKYLSNDYNLRKTISNNAKKNIDGSGIKRISNLILNGHKFS
jgi:UDP-2,4-diacetamido-2,4,6-trideoxy-beta-L-altropyranose hydrolase